MASWNYRILDRGDHFALHEVFYDEAGAITSWTADAISFVADTQDGASAIAEALAMALDDARNRPVVSNAELAALKVSGNSADEEG